MPLPFSSFPRRRLCCRAAARPALVALFLTVSGLVPAGFDQALAQGIADAQPFSGRAIDSISIRITNPLADSAFNSRVEDGVRRALRLFPGSSYSDEQVTLALGAARCIAGIATLDHETLPSAAGGVEVSVLVTLREDAQPDAGRGMA